MLIAVVKIDCALMDLEGLGDRLLRHVPHEAVPKRNSTGTSKRTEPVLDSIPLRLTPTRGLSAAVTVAQLSAATSPKTYSGRRPIVIFSGSKSLTKLAMDISSDKDRSVSNLGLISVTVA